jgi:hypothetical protein
MELVRSTVLVVGGSGPEGVFSDGGGGGGLEESRL